MVNSTANINMVICNCDDQDIFLKNAKQLNLSWIVVAQCPVELFYAGVSFIFRSYL